MLWWGVRVNFGKTNSLFFLYFVQIVVYTLKHFVPDTFSKSIATGYNSLFGISIFQFF